MVERGRLLADRTDLRPRDRDHLRALVADWTLVADLAFADLVLWVPTWNQTGFTAVAQIRPTTGPTAVPEDVVGRFVAKGRRSELDRAYASGKTVRQDPSNASGQVRSPTGVYEAIPVSFQGRVIAVIARQAVARDAHGGAREGAIPPSRRAGDDRCPAPGRGWPDPARSNRHRGRRLTECAVGISSPRPRCGPCWSEPDGDRNPTLTHPRAR